VGTPRRPDGSATEEDRRLAKNLEVLITERGISGRELSRRADVSLDTARNIITGRSTSPRARTLQALADVLGVPLSALYGGEPPPVYVAVQLARMVTIPELAYWPPTDLSGIAAEWSIPADAVGNRLPDRLRIFVAPPGFSAGEVRPGDRLLADMSHKEPSPPGLYAMSDGTRVYVAHVRRAAGKRGMLSVYHGGHTEDAPEKDFTILGRIVARWTTL
jgi:transcriptional regulator with XRE-family HTH domain